MSSDNVFDQVEALIASDERQALPETADAILRAIAKFPGAGPVVALVRYESERQRVENSDLMLRAAWEELKRVSFDIEGLRQDTVTQDEVKRLIIDATRKVEDLRDRKRIERIGMILAHALHWFRLAAEQGNSDGQLGMGMLYKDGLGVPKDGKQAVSWFRAAAKQDNKWAQDMLGLSYSTGFGVSKDDAQAASWYRKAAEQGDSMAQLRLLTFA